MLPAVYARENAYWAAQGRGQDWVDLAVVAPLLAMAAVSTLRGSRVFALLLAGTLAYVGYSFVLYAFFMHFGPLFLLYAAGFGLSFYALGEIVFALRSGDVRDWFAPDAPVRVAGSAALVLGVMFYALWLLEIVPSLAGGMMLKSAVDNGLITNPIEILDLGIVLPAFILGGLALIRRRPLGYWLGPMMLGFAVVMDAALIGMSMSVKSHRPDAGGPPMAMLVSMAIATAAVLIFLLAKIERDRKSGCVQ